MLSIANILAHSPAKREYPFANFVRRSEGVKFTEWLEQELAARKMKPQDLANAGDIDPATLSAIIRERRELGPDVARRIAKGLQLEQWEVFYAAELLTEIPKVFDETGSPIMVSLVQALRQASERDRRLFLAVLRSMNREIRTWEDFQRISDP